MTTNTSILPLPTVLPLSGEQPLSPAFIQQTLLAEVEALNPGYTANLPGLLIEDLSSTAVGALVAADTAYVDLINSVTPYGANEFVLNQLGQIYGITPGLPTNTSVNVIFNGPAGFVISQSFVVSDGTYQYVVQDGGVIPLDGVSLPFFAVATQTGSWAVPANTVNQIVTSLPSGVSISVNNPLAGTPAQGVETEESYRSRVLLAGRSAATGMASLMKTLLGQVPGVDPRLVSVIQNPTAGTGWEVIVGGSGDPYLIAYAIYSADFALPLLLPSVIGITHISSTTVAQITTNLNHGFHSGESIFPLGITSASFTALNGNTYVATVLDEKNFTIPFNSSGFAAFTGGGNVGPNARNQTVSILDYPDTYEVPFVIPPAQTCAIQLLWNTDAPNFTSAPAVNALAVPAIVTYINSIPVGQPVNIFDMEAVFQAAVASVIQTQFISRMIWVVTINGIPTSPNTGTGLVYGDPESYFLTDSTQMNISQG